MKQSTKKTFKGVLGSFLVLGSFTNLFDLPSVDSPETAGYVVGMLLVLMGGIVLMWSAVKSGKKERIG